MLKNKISISILSGNFSDLKDSLKEINTKEEIEYIHLDVMDGNFVKEISFGYSYCMEVKELTNKKIDIHLMNSNPEKYIEKFAEIADILTFHFEIQDLDFVELIKRIRLKNCLAGLAIKPDTKFEEFEHLIEVFDLLLIMTVEPGKGGQEFQKDQFEKIKKTSDYIKLNNLKTILEVDGGINDSNFKLLSRAGVDLFVIGSFLLNKEGFKLDNLDKLKLN